MYTEKRLKEIWNSESMQTLPSFIKERGYCFSVNENQKDILITGINPSFRQGSDTLGSFGFDIQKEFKQTKYDNYWTPLKKMVFDEIEGIDLRKNTAYLDIFYFRNKEQSFLKKKILPNADGLKFIIDQINLTQHLIEKVIKPKLIIVKNKESAAYWGKFVDKGMIWMGYDLQFIEENIVGELYKIIGLIQSKERTALEIENTNLEGTLILFTQHINQYTKREKRPNAKYIGSLMGV